MANQLEKAALSRTSTVSDGDLLLVIDGGTGLKKNAGNMLINYSTFKSGLASDIGDVTADSVSTDTITEDTSGAGVTVDGVVAKDGIVISKPTPVAINATATATAAQILSGYITSTSAAAVTLTLPLAADLATALGATRGTSFEFAVDNSAGANTVTVAVNTGITTNTPAITGGSTLTVSTANAVGIFRIVFITATTAKIFRIA